MSEFKPIIENDYRSSFCNKIIQFIVDKNDYDIDLSVKEAYPLFEDFENIIRNVYELIDNEIPLWRLSNLLDYKSDHGKDNYGYTKEEYDSLVQGARNACEVYYCTKNDN